MGLQGLKQKGLRLHVTSIFQEDVVRNARREIKQEVVDSYQAVLDSQAKRVHEADGQQRRLEGELRVKTEKIRDLEAVRGPRAYHRSPCRVPRLSMYQPSNKP